MNTELFNGTTRPGGYEGIKKTNKKMSGFDKMVEMMEAAYIQVMGKEKWNSLTDQEKHDAIMMIAKGFDAALNNIA